MKKIYMIYDGYHSCVQNEQHQTHPKHNKHVEAIEQRRKNLAETQFSQWDDLRRVTSYSDQLSKRSV